MLWRDIRHAVRRLAKDRSLTLMAVAALSLGIGANNTVFTVRHRAAAGLGGERG
ncbi:MAG: hypothetical protein ABGY72_03580 [bacterium]